MWEENCIIFNKTEVVFQEILCAMRLVEGSRIECGRAGREELMTDTTILCSTHVEMLVWFCSLLSLCPSFPAVGTPPYGHLCQLGLVLFPSRTLVFLAPMSCKMLWNCLDHERGVFRISEITPLLNMSTVSPVNLIFRGAKVRKLTTPQLSHSLRASDHLPCLRLY